MKRAGSLLILSTFLLLSLVLPGCGYRLAGGGILPDNIRIIALKPFENETSRPEIEQRVTEEIAAELSKRGRYKVVTDVRGADALLEGAISEYRTDPVQFTDEGRATRVQAVVTMRATLTDLGDDRVLWSQSGLRFREQFDVAETGGFIDQESIALDDIASGAAGALVTSILEGF